MRQEQRDFLSRLTMMMCETLSRARGEVSCRSRIPVVTYVSLRRMGTQVKGSTDQLASHARDGSHLVFSETLLSMRMR